MIGEFLTFWNVSDLNRAYLYESCYVDDIKMWTKHLDLGYISYVTEKDIGITLGVSTDRITKDLCDVKLYVKISELGEEILMMDSI